MRQSIAVGKRLSYFGLRMCSLILAILLVSTSISEALAAPEPSLFGILGVPTAYTLSKDEQQIGTLFLCIPTDNLATGCLLGTLATINYERGMSDYIQAGSYLAAEILAINAQYKFRLFSLRSSRLDIALMENFWTSHRLWAAGLPNFLLINEGIVSWGATSALTAHIGLRVILGGLSVATLGGAIGAGVNAFGAIDFDLSPNVKTVLYIRNILPFQAGGGLILRFGAFGIELGLLAPPIVPIINLYFRFRGQPRR